MLKSIGYVLAAFVALVGLIYVPFNCIESVKPFTHDTLGLLEALGFLPVILPTSFLIVIAIAFVAGRKRKTSTLYRKTIVGSIFFIATLGAVMLHQQRNSYLESHAARHFEALHRKF